MSTFLLFLGWFVLLTYNDSRRRSGLHWYEIKGITKFLFLGPSPPRKCRACDEALPEDTMFHVELEPGVFYHEDCADEIKLEVGLSYPEWFLQPLPSEQEVTQLTAPVPTYMCACGFRHEEHYICTDLMAKLEVKPELPAAFADWMREMDSEAPFGKAKENAPGSDGDWFASAHGGGGSGVTYERVNPYGSELKMVVNGQMVCPNPGMNTVIADPWRPRPGELSDDELIHFFRTGVRHCKPCRADHREHEKCPRC